jgi:hypothetical protein
MCILDICIEVDESINNMWPSCACQDYDVYATGVDAAEEEEEAKRGSFLLD